MTDSSIELPQDLIRDLRITSGCLIFYPPTLSLEKLIISLLHQIGTDQVYLLTRDPTTLIHRYQQVFGQLPDLGCCPSSIREIPPRSLVLFTDLDGLPIRELILRRPIFLLTWGVTSELLEVLDQLSEISLSWTYLCPYTPCQRLLPDPEEPCPRLPLKGPRFSANQQTLVERPLIPSPLPRLRVGELNSSLVLAKEVLPLPNLVARLIVNGPNLVLESGVGGEVEQMLLEYNADFARYQPDRESLDTSTLKLELFLRNRIPTLLFRIPSEDQEFNWPALPGLRGIMVVGRDPRLINFILEAVNQVGREARVPGPFGPPLLLPKNETSPETLKIEVSEPEILTQLQEKWNFFHNQFQQARGS